VKKAVFREFGVRAENDIEFVRRMEALARETGFCYKGLTAWAPMILASNVLIKS